MQDSTASCCRLDTNSCRAVSPDAPEGRSLGLSSYCHKGGSKNNSREAKEGLTSPEGIVIDPAERRHYLKQVNVRLGAYLMEREAVAVYGPMVYGRAPKGTGAKVRAPRAATKGQGGTYAVFATLTFARVEEFSPGVISDYRRRRRDWARARGLDYRAVWVLERGDRGRLHYHCVEYWPLSLREFPPLPDASHWRYGSTNAQFVHSDAARYLAKYLGKQGGASLPKGARSSGVVGLSSQGREALRRKKLPAYVQAVCVDAKPLERFSGGGWVDKATGEYRHSLFEVQFFHGVGPVAYRLEERVDEWKRA